MKYLFRYLICIILVITLTGCGKASKEYVLKNSTELNWNEFLDELNDNKVNAIEKYENNYYYITGKVVEIEKDHMFLSCATDDGFPSVLFMVYLPKEENKKIKNFQQIQIAGKLTEIADTTPDYMDFSKNNGIVKDAYLIKDEFEITEKVEFPKNDGYTYNGNGNSTFYYNTNPVWRLKIGKYYTEEVKEKHFKNEGDITILDTKIKDGDTILIKGKIYEWEIKNISKIKVLEQNN